MNLTPYHLVQTDVAVEADRTFLTMQLRSFNNQVSPYHRQIRTEPPRPLDLFLRNVEQQIVAGLTASTYWSCLEIEKLWVRDDLRRHGYGHQLLTLAETEAQARGCTYAWLSTFSFQARGFYENYGYRVIGQLTDYPPGETYFWLRKDFAL